MLVAQSIRGRVLDPARRPLVGALVELRDLSGKSLEIMITSPSGAFQLTAPASGRYLFRVAAIGFQPRPPSSLDVPADGVVLPDIVLATMAMRLPDLVALGRSRFCGKSGLTDEIFSRVLESAHSALQIMQTTIESQQVSFQVAVINTATYYGAFNNLEAADTVVQPLARWPVQSIDPDTLKAVGAPFAELVAPLEIQLIRRRVLLRHSRMAIGGPDASSHHRTGQKSAVGPRSASCLRVD